MTNIMKFLEFNARIMKIIKSNYSVTESRNNEILRIPCRNQENHENLIIPRQNYENIEIARIPCQNNENHENSIIPRQNYEKIKFIEFHDRITKIMNI